jgi:hypothetical protein
MACAHDQNVETTAEDGTKLHGWFMYPDQWNRRGPGGKAEALKARPVVLFFQVRS